MNEQAVIKKRASPKKYEKYIKGFFLLFFLAFIIVIVQVKPCISWGWHIVICILTTLIFYIVDPQIHKIIFNSKVPEIGDIKVKGISALFLFLIGLSAKFSKECPQNINLVIQTQGIEKIKVKPKNIIFEAKLEDLRTGRLNDKYELVFPNVKIGQQFSLRITNSNYYKLSDSIFNVPDNGIITTTIHANLPDEVYGKVLDAENHQPINNVEVMTENIFISTDTMGNFKIPLRALKEKEVLLITFTKKGYMPDQIEINSPLNRPVIQTLERIKINQK